MEKVGNDAYSLDVNGHCALLTSGRLILVDTGTESNAESLLAEIKASNYKPSDIEYIIITHVHPDHVGGLNTMKQISSARIASHDIEAKYITLQEDYPGPPGKLTKIFPDYQPVQIDDLLVDNQVYQGLLVIHTPGHTPGNIALLDQESKLLIAGDSLRTDDGIINPMPDQYNIDPQEHRESMKKLLNYEFEKMIVGHGHPMHSHAHTKLQEAIK